MIVTILAIVLLVIGVLGIVGSIVWGLKSKHLTPDNLRGWYGKMFLGFQIIILVLSIAAIATGVILLLV